MIFPIIIPQRSGPSSEEEAKWACLWIGMSLALVLPLYIILQPVANWVAPEKLVSSVDAVDFIRFLILPIVFTLIILTLPPVLCLPFMLHTELKKKFRGRPWIVWGLKKLSVWIYFAILGYGYSAYALQIFHH